MVCWGSSGVVVVVSAGGVDVVIFRRGRGVKRWDWGRGLNGFRI